MDGNAGAHPRPKRERVVENYRYSTNPQVVIDANTRLTTAIGKPLPGNRNDCRAYTESGVDQHCTGAHVMADGGGRLCLPLGSCGIHAISIVERRFCGGIVGDGCFSYPFGSPPRSSPFCRAISVSSIRGTCVPLRLEGGMDRIELVEALRAAGVPDGEYLIPGGPASRGPRADAYYVLREEPGVYLVTLWERGVEETAARFASEDEACRYLHSHLTRRAPAPLPDSAQVIEALMARREDIQREAREQYDRARRHERG